MENGVYLMARAQAAREALITLVCLASAGYLFYALLGSEDAETR
ncbi:MAG: hypothetical protein WA005_16660 [Candidatus Binataceae bacterium]